MKAVLVICEGQHDTIFVQRSLGAVAGCDWFDGAIQELPSPFGSIEGRSRKGLIATRLERNVEGFTLRKTSYPPLPHFESAVVDEAAETLFVLIRANGKKQAGAVTEWLRELDDSLDIGPVDISAYAVAFLFDANDEGLAATLAAFRRDYGGHFGDLSDANHAHWTSGVTCPVGVFVIHRSASNPTGTLEDHVAPLAEVTWPAHFEAAKEFIDVGRQPDESASKSEANRLKAIITCAGQFEHPGATLATLVARDGIPSEHFSGCPLSQDLVRFLQAVPWQTSSAAA